MDVLGAIDASASSSQVLKTAAEVAKRLGMGVRALHVTDHDPIVAGTIAAASGVPLRVRGGDPASEILAALEDDDIAVAVIGAGSDRAVDRPFGVVVRDVMTRASKPVVVVPRRVVLPGPDVPARVVVPLDGSRLSSEASGSVVRRLAAGGAEVMALHVFGPAAAPRYWDRWYYDLPAWHREFQRANCNSPGTRLKMRCGCIASEVVRTASEQHAALVVLAWSQHLSPGRAATVKAVLAASQVPVLLVPVAPAETSRPSRPTRRARPVLARAAA